MLIRKIIEENKDDLKLFRKAADKTGFIQHVEAMLTEFKHYCIQPEDLIPKQKSSLLEHLPGLYQTSCMIWN